MKKRIKTNDIVKIIYGKDKGKIGKIIKIIDNKFVYVEGMKIVKKHVKKSSNFNVLEKIILIESKIHISNVVLLKK